MSPARDFIESHWSDLFGLMLLFMAMLMTQDGARLNSDPIRRKGDELFGTAVGIIGGNKIQQGINRSRARRRESKKP
jgi:hypothetical protein